MDPDETALKVKGYTLLIFCHFYILPYNDGGIVWFHLGCPCVCMYVCQL